MDAQLNNSETRQDQEPIEAQVAPAREEGETELAEATLPASIDRSLRIPGVESKPANQDTVDAPTRAESNSSYSDPKPNGFLIRGMVPFARWFMQGTPLVRDLPLVNRLPLGRGVFKVKRFDFPKDEVAKFKASVNKDTVAFVAPNHPEFFVDWAIDKEVTTRVAPDMANLAAESFVNMKGLSWLWSGNNLVANTSKAEGGRGTEYLKEQALAGKGVLLHPEGAVRWTGSKVHSLFPGIVEMPMDIASKMYAGPESEHKEVNILPFVTRHYFERDVTSELGKEIGALEKRLKLPKTGKKEALEERFAALQTGILEKQEQKFDVKPAPEMGFFDRQDRLFNILMTQLEDRYGKQRGELPRQLHRMKRTIKASYEENPQQARLDLRKVVELERLTGFSRDVYDSPVLIQEQIAESLQRVRSDVVSSKLEGKPTWKDELRKLIPPPVAERVCVVRAAEPIDVLEEIKQAGGSSARLKMELLKETHTRMQAMLDYIESEIEPVVMKFARPNPFRQDPNS